jgi:dipeptidyl aminopeptidase/acylaminoacyl peptidase
MGRPEKAKLRKLVGSPKFPLTNSQATGLCNSGYSYFITYLVESDEYSPNVSYGFGNGTLGFINSNTIYFQSEVTGFSHLYTLDLNSKKKTALTSGNWEVRNAQLSNDKKSFYLTTRTTHHGNRSYYKFDIASKKMTGIFTNDGAYEVEIAPDEKSFLVRYSFKNKTC